MRFDSPRADRARVQSRQGAPAAASEVAPCLQLDGRDSGSRGGNRHGNESSVEGGSWGRARVGQRERAGALDGETHGNGPLGRICGAGDGVMPSVGAGGGAQDMSLCLQSLRVAAELFLENRNGLVQFVAKVASRLPGFAAPADSTLLYVPSRRDCCLSRGPWRAWRSHFSQVLSLA